MRRGAITALATGASLAILGLGAAACMQGATRPPAAGMPALANPGFGLFYMDEGGSAKLAYGQANSDNVDLMLQCAKGSRLVEVIDNAQTLGAPALTLVSNGKIERLKTRAEDGEGGPVLVAETASNTAPMASFRRSGRLEVSRGSAHFGLIATADERVDVERFFTACGG